MSAEQDIEQQLRRKLQEEITREQEAGNGEEQRTGRHVQDCPAAGARATAEGSAEHAEDQNDHLQSGDSAEQAALRVLKALGDVDPEYIHEAGEKLDFGMEPDSIHTEETGQPAEEQEYDERFAEGQEPDEWLAARSKSDGRPADDRKVGSRSDDRPSAEGQEPVSRGGKDIYQVDDLDVKPGTRPEAPDDFTEIQMDTLGEDALLPEFDELEADEEGTSDRTHVRKRFFGKRNTTDEEKAASDVRRAHGTQTGRRGFFPGRGSGRRAPDRNSDESFHRHINVWGTMAAAAAICLVAAGLYQNLQRSAIPVSQIPDVQNTRRTAAPTHEELQEAAAAETAEENSGEQPDTGTGASEKSAGGTEQGENLTENGETQSGGTESKQAASKGEGTVTVTGKAEGSSVPVEEQAADSAAADAADSSPKTEAAIGNPWNTFDTLEEAEACADVEITIPDQIDGYDVLIYQAIQGEILEIIYQNADGEEGLRIRKSSYPDGSGMPDISGDYNSYSQHSTLKSIQVGSGTGSQTVNVKLAGDHDIVKNTIWSAKAGAASTNYAYAIVFDGAEFSATEVGKLVSEIY